MYSNFLSFAQLVVQRRQSCCDMLFRPPDLFRYLWLSSETLPDSLFRCSNPGFCAFNKWKLNKRKLKKNPQKITELESLMSWQSNGPKFTFQKLLFFFEIYISFIHSPTTEL